MVRVETEVYAMLLTLNHELEEERLRRVSLSETIRSALERAK